MQLKKCFLMLASILKRCFCLFVCFCLLFMPFYSKFISIKSSGHTRPWKGIKDYKLLPKPLIKDQPSCNGITALSPHSCERTQNEVQQRATGTYNNPFSPLFSTSSIIQKKIVGSIKSSRSKSSYKGCSCYQPVKDS